MIQEEKDRLLALFEAGSSWCQGADAMDQHGQTVHFDDEQAVSWDIVGGLCHLFGWKRAFKLFEPVGRYLTGRRLLSLHSRNQEIAAMSALLDFNDDQATTYELMMARLRDIPVWKVRRLPI